MSLTTTGRRSGRPRTVIVAYLEDGPNLIVLAMNGWDDGHPAWWLNLQAHPDAVIRLPGRPEQAARAHEAEGVERERLWARWLELEPETKVYAARHDVRTPVVILEPVEAS
jgi:deazaflavin-dependent oxidoreductase (nitroreductase family)